MNEKKEEEEENDEDSDRIVNYTCNRKKNSRVFINCWKNQREKERSNNGFLDSIEEDEREKLTITIRISLKRHR